MLKRKAGKMKRIEIILESESKIIMLASEEVLKNDWDNEYDKRWNSII